MSDADILEIAARQAECQPGPGAAIRAAMTFVDHYPGALRAAEAAAGPVPGISLALVLSTRCSRRDDVARFFRQAAGGQP